MDWILNYRIFRFDKNDKLVQVTQIKVQNHRIFYISLQINVVSVVVSNGQHSSFQIKHKNINISNKPTNVISEYTFRLELSTCIYGMCCSYIVLANPIMKLRIQFIIMKIFMKIVKICPKSPRFMVTHIQGCESSDFNLISYIFALHKTPFSDLKYIAKHLFRHFKLFQTFFLHRCSHTPARPYCLCMELLSTVVHSPIAMN